jgi:hypothetical protein
MMPVRLRGHHFLCILTYKGFGYSPDFVVNMTAIVEDISNGRPVVLMHGPDDICGGLSAEDSALCKHDCALAETRDLDLHAVREVSALLQRDLSAALELSKDDVANLRQAFAKGSIRNACARCPWHDFCDEIVAEDYAGTKLHARAD